ncbi:hypothetical protein D3C75_549780 [compost metagenome]
MRTQNLAHIKGQLRRIHLEKTFATPGLQMLTNRCGIIYEHKTKIDLGVRLYCLLTCCHLHCGNDREFTWPSAGRLHRQQFP